VKSTSARTVCVVAVLLLGSCGQDEQDTEDSFQQEQAPQR
jgi:hypothetical protein